MEIEEYKSGMRVIVCPRAYEQYYNYKIIPYHWIFDPGVIGIIKDLVFQNENMFNVEFIHQGENISYSLPIECLVADE